MFRLFDQHTVRILIKLHSNIVQKNRSEIIIDPQHAYRNLYWNRIELKPILVQLSSYN